MGRLGLVRRWVAESILFDIMRCSIRGGSRFRMPPTHLDTYMITYMHACIPLHVHTYIRLCLLPRLIKSAELSL